MYFIHQIKRQFFYTLAAFEIGSGTDNAGTPVVENKEDTKKTELDQNQKDRLQDLEELKRDLDSIRGGEKYLSKMLARYGQGLEKIASGLEPGYGPEDADYQELKRKYDVFTEAYNELEAEGQEIAHIVDLRLSELDGELTEQIGELQKDSSDTGEEVVPEKTAETPLDTFQKYIQETCEAEGIPKNSLLILLQQKYDFSDVADDEYEQKLADEFLKKPENFKADLTSLIEDWKEAKIQTDGPEAYTPENYGNAVAYYARNGSIDPVGEAQRAISGSNSEQMDDGTLMGKIRLFLYKLFGIDIHGNQDGALSTYGGSQEAINGMLSQTGNLNELGSLSEFYESGGKGPEATNGNDNGKPSFGTYQLRADYLKQFAEKLGIQGNHEETFSSGGETEFSKNWLAKVEEIGVDAFKKQEHDFIKATHYDKVVANSGFDVSKASIVVQNVIWSTSVQHGPGTDIIRQAVTQLGNFTPGDKASEEAFIQKVYEIRGQKYEGGRGRYTQEQRMALTQLRILPGSVVDIPVGDIRSVQKQVARNPDGSVKMTYCARTARLNADRFGVSVPQLESARDLENSYKNAGRLTDSPQGSVFQIFSGSKRFPNYGHVATGFVLDGQAYVLDPYLPATGSYTHNPIPLAQYVSYLNARRGGLRGIATIG